MYIVSTTAIEPVSIYWNLEYNDYELNPIKFNNRGKYTVLVRSCVPTSTKPVCVFSPTWEIEVYDPC